MSSTSNFSITLSHLGVSSIPITAVWTFSGLCVTAALLVAYLDYAAWYALGPGGPPHSVKGWMSVHRVGLLRNSNVLDISVFDTLIKCRPEEGQSYLTLSTTPPLAHVKSSSTFDELPTRRGPRPQISRWVAPIRQLSETANDELKAKMYDSLASLGSANPEYFVVGPSAMERGHGPRPNALLLRADVPADATNTTRLCSCETMRSREVYHIHWTDGSIHCIVSAADARALVARGWAEQFPLGGVPNAFPGLPATFLMVYAPRDEDELRVHAAIMRAAAAYALGSIEKLSV